MIPVPTPVCIPLFSTTVHTSWPYYEAACPIPFYNYMSTSVFTLDSRKKFATLSLKSPKLKELENDFVGFKGESSGH